METMFDYTKNYLNICKSKNLKSVALPGPWTLRACVNLRIRSDPVLYLVIGQAGPAHIHWRLASSAKSIEKGPCQAAHPFEKQGTFQSLLIWLSIPLLSTSSHSPSPC